jgi:hypothetical protein
MFALGFPLLLVPFAIYNMIAFLTPGVSWDTAVLTVQMISGQAWMLTWGDALLLVALFLLWLEIIKSNRAGRRAAMDHMLAVALLLAMAAEFLLVQRAATSTFFLLTAITLTDVLAGFVSGTRRVTGAIEIESPGQV